MLIVSCMLKHHGTSRYFFLKDSQAPESLLNVYFAVNTQIKNHDEHYYSKIANSLTQNSLLLEFCYIILRL